MYSVIHSCKTIQVVNNHAYVDWSEKLFYVTNFSVHAFLWAEGHLKYKHLFHWPVNICIYSTKSYYVTLSLWTKMAAAS